MGPKPKIAILHAKQVRELTSSYYKKCLENAANICREETAEMIQKAYTNGRYSTEIKVNSDDPLTIRAWSKVGAELAELNYQHTYNWEADRRPMYLISVEVRWDGGDW